MSGWPRFLPSGDAAFSVELGEDISREVSAQVVRLHRAFGEARLAGVVETVPAFRSLLVQFDPFYTSPAELQGAILAMLADMCDAPLLSRQWRVPVCYAPVMSLDLAEVAAACGLTETQVVEYHASVTYHVYMLGFLPGFAYMGDLPAPLRLPRRDDPRTRVPCGSVAIANGLTAIYPQESPGGWHVIGRTTAVLFDPGAARPALFETGDLVRFEPVSLAEFEVCACKPNGGAQLFGEAV